MDLNAGMRELRIGETDLVSGGMPWILGVALGYVIGKTLNHTPIGDAVDAVLEPVHLPGAPY
jgi:hypothetical protein